MAFGSAAAEPPALPLPAKLQVALFRKVLAYDRRLGDAGSFRLIVVHGPGEAVEARQIAHYFQSLGIGTRSADEGSWKTLADGVPVVYVLPGGRAPDLLRFCAAHRILTISGAPALVAAGEVSIGIASGEDGRPEITVNLARVKSEGHALSSGLLQIARVNDMDLQELDRLSIQQLLKIQPNAAKSNPGGARGAALADGGT